MKKLTTSQRLQSLQSLQHQGASLVLAITLAACATPDKGGCGACGHLQLRTGYQPNAVHHWLRQLTRAEWQEFIGDFLPYRKTCHNLPTPADTKEVK